MLVIIIISKSSHRECVHTKMQGARTASYDAMRGCSEGVRERRERSQGGKVDRRREVTGGGGQTGDCGGDRRRIESPSA